MGLARGLFSHLKDLHTFEKDRERIPEETGGVGQVEETRKKEGTSLT